MNHYSSDNETFIQTDETHKWLPSCESVASDPWIGYSDAAVAEIFIGKELLMTRVCKECYRRMIDGEKHPQSYANGYSCDSSYFRDWSLPVNSNGGRRMV